MEPWKDLCFALDCFRIFIWAILALGSSTLLAWLLIIHGDDEAEFFVKCEWVICSVVFSVIQGSIAIVLRTWWPEFTGDAFAAIWALISGYAALELFLKPLAFRIEQKIHYLLG